MTKKLYAFIIGFFLAVGSTYGQQDAQYSQYLYNMSIVNPAYVTGQPSLINVGSLYRTQWVGLDGAPTTINAFAHVPINEKIELTGNFTHDEIGDIVNNNNFNVDFAYITKLSKWMSLSYGLKVGMSNTQLNFSGTNVANEAGFTNNSSTKLNIGAGAYLFTDNFYAGLSSPNLIPNDVSIDDAIQSEDAIHAYAIAGYVFDLSTDVKLKPSTVIKSVVGAPLTFDLSLNSLILERFELGVSYRLQDALIGIAGVNVTHNFKVGYSYDYSLGDLQDFNSGSHEIILLYNFDLLSLSKKYTSPRFF